MRSDTPRLALALATLGAAAAGCDVEYDTEDGRYGLDDDVLVFDDIDGFASGDPVLVGSRACPFVDGWYATPGDPGSYKDASDDEPWIEACFDRSVAGPASLGDDGCITFGDIGEAEVSFAPRPCDAPADAPRFDDARVRYEVVAADGLRVRFDPWLERLFEAVYHPGPAGTFPDDWQPDASEPLRIVDGAWPMLLRLYDPATVQSVAWSDLVVEVAANGDVEEHDELGEFAVGEGDVLTVAVTVPAGSFDVGTVVGLPIEAAQSLALVPVYNRAGSGDGWGPPLGVRALLRDGDRNVLYGAPVEWSVVEGEIELGPITDDDPFGTDFVGVEDRCAESTVQPTARHAVVRASLGPLEDVVELTWTALPWDHGDFPAPEAPPGCPTVTASCACRSGPSEDPAWPAVLAVLVALVRPRPRRATSGRSVAP